MTPGRTDSNHGRPPSFFTTASAPSMSVVCPPETCEPWTCPFFLPRPMSLFFRAKAEWGRRVGQDGRQEDPLGAPDPPPSPIVPAPGRGRYVGPREPAKPWTG